MTLEFIDLSHPITQDMPVYPGTEPPVITRPCTLGADGFNEIKLCLYSHTGTHLDCPAHIVKDGLTLDELPTSHFYGRAAVVDVTGVTGPEILTEDLVIPGGLRGLDFVILYTGWCHRWGAEDYFTGFPVPAAEAAGYLAELGLKGVGIDALSVDRAGSGDFQNHRILLQNNLVILENLTNLRGLTGRVFTLACFPLRLPGADGSPVRAVALCD